MKNNLAELLDVSINIEDLRTAWDKQVILSKNYTYLGVGVAIKKSPYGADDLPTVFATQLFGG